MYIILALENFIIIESFDFFWKIFFLDFWGWRRYYCRIDFIMINCKVLSFTVCKLGEKKFKDDRMIIVIKYWKRKFSLLCGLGVRFESKFFYDK